MRHKHADLIHAWAEGAEIEIYDLCIDQWNECSYPSFVNKCKYRIKPTPNPDVVWYANPRIDGDMCAYMSKIPVAGSNLKLTFDGDTGELKAAEVLK
jgi:hypothetical protein